MLAVASSLNSANTAANEAFVQSAAELLRSAMLKPIPKRPRQIIKIAIGAEVWRMLAAIRKDKRLSTALAKPESLPKLFTSLTRRVIEALQAHSTLQ
jgi:hypothetical protein